jgi:hypothetical protein
MARELDMNPTKLGKIANHRQEPWKQLLPQFIESTYLKRFGRARPERVVRIEERALGEEEEDDGADALCPTAAGRSIVFRSHLGVDVRRSPDLGESSALHQRCQLPFNRSETPYRV